MANIFLQIDGAKGETTDEKFKDQIEVMSFDFGIDQPASSSASSRGGGTTGTAQFHNMSITKEVDAASPKLKEFCATGKHIDKCVMTVCRDAGDGQRVEYLKYTLTNTIISRYSISGGHNGSLPVENIGLDFGKIEWEYTPQKRAGGQGGGKIAGGHDLQTNKKL